MRLPVIEGTIKRRLLVNYRVKPDLLDAELPAPLRAKRFRGWGVAGICLIRLEGVGPRGTPIAISSENAAHRIAVEWTDEQGVAHEGVFIKRRDTSSFLNRLAGGRVFPGVHHAATFDVKDDGRSVALTLEAKDGAVSVHVRGHVAANLPATSIFSSLEDASHFFERGSDGYSPGRTDDHLDGLRLETQAWRVEPFEVEEARSSWLDDRAKFPEGTVALDHALVMRDVAHSWRALDDLRVTPRRAKAAAS